MSTEKQENYTISEGFDLPSKGLIYNTKVNPHVELRSMSARDEMKRLSPSSTPLKTLADIIEGCMLEKPAVHVYDMAFGDYEYLLHKLRIVTYGEDYKVALTCSNCGEFIETTAKLSELEVKDFNNSEFEALRTFTLPVSGHVVSLKFQTPRMLDSIDNKAKELKKRAKGAGINFDIYAQLLSIIDTVDDKVMSSTDLDIFIDNLTARDMNKILNTADKLNSCIGIDNTLVLTCDKCGEDTTTFFRFGPEFFRPSNI